MGSLQGVSGYSPMAMESLDKSSGNSLLNEVCTIKIVNHELVADDGEVKHVIDDLVFWQYRSIVMDTHRRFTFVILEFF